MSSETQTEMESQFGGERSEWTERIRELSIRMKNIREMAEVQVELYSKLGLTFMISHL